MHVGVYVIIWKKKVLNEAIILVTGFNTGRFDLKQRLWPM
jgi:hypothetical protein